MQRWVLAGLLVALVAYGGWELWQHVQESKAAEEELKWSAPFNQALAAYQQKRYLDAEAILMGPSP